jgi:hypothetical protein
MTHWLAVATAENCAALARLGHPFYALQTAPRVAPGDRCILYRSGKSRGFIGEFEFVAAPISESIRLTDVRPFAFRLPWKLVATREDAPIGIEPLVKNLSFIKNKNNYGMTLRTPFRSIEKVDFDHLSHLLRNSN